MQLLGSIAAVALASATLCGTAHAQGSAPYDPSGWRPATEYEKKVRKTWEQAKRSAVLGGRLLQLLFLLFSVRVFSWQTKRKNIDEHRI